jgi:hypothetical protein
MLDVAAGGAALGEADARLARSIHAPPAMSAAS